MYLKYYLFFFNLYYGCVTFLKLNSFKQCFEFENIKYFSIMKLVL